MSLRPVVIEQFPGLDLRADPGDARGAIDLSDVTLIPGGVRTRDGSSTFYTPANTPYFLDSFRLATGPQLIVGVAGNPGTFSAVNSAGTVVASTTAGGLLTSNGASGLAIGSPSATTYYAVSEGAVIQKWTGAAWSSPAGMPGSPKILALSPTDNRLVVCDTASKVYFSDPGAPETFGANNFLYLTPGDGEVICGAAVFNNQLFIFKQTKFFVFYGTSTDSTGTPVFNYRTIATGLGLHSTAAAVPQAVCVGTDGVYFVADDGVYRTTGGGPQKISEPIQPFFDATTGPFWQNGNWAPAGGIPSRIAWLGDCLYVSLAKSGVSGRRVFVYNRSLGAWTCWTMGSVAMVAFDKSSTAGVNDTMMMGLTSNIVVKMDSTLTADSGTAIVSRYRLPFETYGNPAEKRIREVIVEGSGAPTIGVTADWSSTGITKVLTLGTAPALNDDRMHNAWRGRAFSIQLSAASGAWAVNRVQANVADATRPVSVTI